MRDVGCGLWNGELKEKGRRERQKETDGERSKRVRVKLRVARRERQERRRGSRKVLGIIEREIVADNQGTSRVQKLAKSQGSIAGNHIIRRPLPSASLQPESTSI